MEAGNFIIVLIIDKYLLLQNDLRSRFYSTFYQVNAQNLYLVNLRCKSIPIGHLVGKEKPINGGNSNGRYLNFLHIK